MEKTKNHWWQTPRLRTDENERKERRVTWLELFYDLVFVVVIAQLAHHLATHTTFSGVINFVLLFIPVWWLWIIGTYYAERFETDDVSIRLLTFMQMLPVAALAVFAYEGVMTQEGLSYGLAGFTISYIIGRLIQMSMWVRAGFHDKRFKPVSNRYTIGFSLAILIYIIALIFPNYRYVLWGIGLIIELTTPIMTLKIQKSLPRLSTSKRPERFGLFVIIVLGEMVVAVVQGLAQQPNRSLNMALGVTLGIALTFCIWWLYFDCTARRPPSTNIWWSLFWGYFHLPLVVGIVATGAGLLNLIAIGGDVLPVTLSQVIGGGVAVSLIAMGLIEMTTQGDDVYQTHRSTNLILKFMMGIVVAIIGWIGSGLEPIIFLSLLIGIVASHIIYDIYTDQMCLFTYSDRM